MSDVDAVRMAGAYADGQQWDRALTVLAPVIAANPTHARALCIVAVCHLGLRDPATALSAANSAAAAAPDDEWAARLQSASLRALGRGKQARVAADRAVRLAPMNSFAHVERAQADVSARRLTKPGKASAAQAVRLAPGHADVHVTMGNVWLVQGQRGKAEAAYREALRIDPNNVAAQHNLANLAASRSQLGTAARLLIGLIRADPTSAVYAATLRGLLSAAIGLAAMVCGVAALFVVPGGGRPQATPAALAATLLVWVVVQGGLAWRLHTASPGSSAIRFLASGGWRGRLLRVGLVALVAADAVLIVAVVASVLGAAGAASAAAGTAMILCLVASLTAICSAAQRPGRRRASGEQQ